MRPAALVIASLLCACGGGGHPAPKGGGSGAGTASAASGAPDAGIGGAAIASGSAGAGALSRDECVAFFGHVVDVGMAEKRKTMPADQAPTADDAAKAKQKLVDEAMAECLQMPRTMFDCAMKAQDGAAMQRCQPAP